MKERESKRGKDKEVNGQGGKKGAPAPHRTRFLLTISILVKDAAFR